MSMTPASVANDFSFKNMMTGGELPIIPPPMGIPPPLVPMIVIGIIAGLVMLGAAFFNPITLPATMANALSFIVCLIIVYFIAKKYKEVAWVLSIIFVVCALSSCMGALSTLMVGTAAIQTLTTQLTKP
jgi:predicted PurR-regulated permease PerM